MYEEVDRLMSSPHLEMLAFFSVAAVMLVVCMAVFNLLTRYNVWAEIQKGNMAVAMATGGKIFGICNIFHYSIMNNDTLLNTVMWSGYGFALLMVAYFVFELVTPKFKINVEIQRGNRAVGFISAVISISLSYVIGACVV